MPIYFIVPLFCALGYAIGALFIKRAAMYGAGAMRILFLINWGLFLFYLPSLAEAPTVLDWSLWWAPVLASLCNFSAGLLMMLSIRLGDVSIQAPLMGTKVVFVASLSFFYFNNPVPLTWWYGAFLTLLAIFLVSYTKFQKSKAAYLSILCTLSCAIIFSFRDLIFVQAAQAFGYDAFFLMTFALLAFESLFMIPLFRQELSKTPPKAWKWSLFGATTLALQQTGLLHTLAKFDHATAVNIMYSSRGIWSVLLILLLGHWFGSKEQDMPRSVLIRRLLGALLMCAAITLVLMEG